MDAWPSQYSRRSSTIVFGDWFLGVDSAAFNLARSVSDAPGTNMVVQFPLGGAAFQTASFYVFSKALWSLVKLCCE